MPGWSGATKNCDSVEDIIGGREMLARILILLFALSSAASAADLLVKVMGISDGTPSQLSMTR
jgi:hypothetical protein